uniref:TGF-beta family profile domain-containing protein n=1 Tax=Ditylenchus dipsaci TaxID=166011 RepID=A0A915DPV3_9BILA
MVGLRNQSLLETIPTFGETSALMKVECSQSSSCPKVLPSKCRRRVAATETDHQTYQMHQWTAKYSPSLLRFKSSSWLLLVMVLLCVNVFVITNAAEVQKRCASCSQRSFEEYKQIRQEQILNELLNKLELSAKPNVTVDYDNLPPIGRSNPKIKALIEQSLRENHKRVRKSTRKITPQMSYVVAGSPPDWFNQEGQIAFFSFSPSMAKKYVNKAVLNVFLRRPEEYRFLRIPIRVEIYERFPNGTLKEKIAVKHEHIQADKAETQVQVHLDELDVQQWLQRGNGADGGSMVGLYVQAIHDNENLVYYPEDDQKDVMFLELEVYDYGGRQRRSAPNVCRTGQSNNQTKCCLYDLVIDFEKVGWEFVIAPKRYNAYICNGECTSTQISSTPRGTIGLQANLEFFQCCHPKDYTGITIVYVTADNQIWVKEVPGMVARKCGCA